MQHMKAVPTDWIDPGFGRGKNDTEESGNAQVRFVYGTSRA
jgi:hypothetical protein